MTFVCACTRFTGPFGDGPGHALASGPFGSRQGERLDLVPDHEERTAGVMHDRLGYTAE